MGYALGYANITNMAKSLNGAKSKLFGTFNYGQVNYGEMGKLLNYAESVVHNLLYQPGKSTVPIRNNSLQCFSCSVYFAQPPRHPCPTLCLVPIINSYAQLYAPCTLPTLAYTRT